MMRGRPVHGVWTYAIVISPLYVAAWGYLGRVTVTIFSMSRYPSLVR